MSFQIAFSFLEQFIGSNYDICPWISRSFHFSAGKDVKEIEQQEPYINKSFSIQLPTIKYK